MVALLLLYNLLSWWMVYLGKWGLKFQENKNPLIEIFYVYEQFQID